MSVAPFVGPAVRISHHLGFSVRYDKQTHTQVDPTPLGATGRSTLLR